MEERERGVASVSAPVRDAGGDVVAAVWVSGPIERTTRAPGRRYAAAVVGRRPAPSKACWPVIHDRQASDTSVRPTRRR